MWFPVAMAHMSLSRVICIGSALVVFAVACVLPLAYMLVTAIADGGYSALLLGSRQRELLTNSAWLGIGTAALATVVGLPLGLGLARIPSRHVAITRIVLAAPLLLPPYIAGLAWIYLGGSAGIVATLAGRDLLSAWTYSLPAAIVVLALVYYPVVMLATESAVRLVDPRLEEAALTVASPGRVFTRITLPLSAPSIGAAALVVFVLAIAEFGVPGLLRVRVYTTEVFTAFAALYDFGRATVLTFPLLLLTAVVTAIAGIVGGERVIAGRRPRGVARHLDCVTWSGPFHALAAAIIATALILPVGVLVREAAKVTSVLQVVAGSWSSIRASLLLACAGATLVLVIASCLGYARARASSRVGRVADVVLVVMFAVPSTVVGIGLIGVWNRPGLFGELYGTNAMLLLVYLARFVPVATLVVAASTRQIPFSHEEAAAVGGAGWLRTVASIVAPQLTRGAAAAWVIVFVLAFGELGASILVSPPGESTLPIRIYTIIANTPSSTVAALALLQVIVIFSPLAAAALYLTRRKAI